MKGVVKWFESKLGYGFVASDEGRDHYAHVTDVVTRDERGRNLGEGDVVEFDSEETGKQPRARNISVVKRMPLKNKFYKSHVID